MEGKDFYELMLTEFGADTVTSISESGPEQIIQIHPDHIVRVCTFLASDSRTQ